MRQIVYRPQYNIRACGLERLHPFDAQKYRRAMRRLEASWGEETLHERTAAPKRRVGHRQFARVHDPAYLKRLRNSRSIARALELPQLARVPSALLRLAVLHPMQWGCAGTLLAGRLALRHAFAVNMSGGYHHAKPAAGEGFCIYNDIALLVHDLRAAGELAPQATVAYVDLDVHQGNGVCHCFANDHSLRMFDMFNRTVYPAGDQLASARIDYPVPLDPGCGTEEYLGLLQTHLPEFLESLMAAGNVALLVYNAGTDILAGDPLGGLRVSHAGIVERDLYVIGETRRRGIPCVMLLSGGYTDESHAVIADSIRSILSHSESASADGHASVSG